MNPPAFQFYPDDFIGGTVDLSAKEVGAYIRLLCYQWSRGEIPKTKQAIDRVSGCCASDNVLKKFPHGKNIRLEQERKKQNDWREKQRQNGIASGKARANHRSTTVQPPLNDGGNQKATKPEPNVNQTSTKTQLSTLLSPSPNTESSAGAEGKAFIEGWVQAYKSRWKVDYFFKGGRDGKAVKELMTLGIMRIDLLEIANKAWNANPPTFETRQAQTIHGFREYINQLNLYAKNGNTQISKPNPRNAGVVVGPTDYATAKPRLQRELEAKAARLAGQVAPTTTPPPAVGTG